MIRRVLKPIISKGRDTILRMIPTSALRIAKSFSTRFLSLPKFSDLAQYDDRYVTFPNKSRDRETLTFCIKI